MKTWLITRELIFRTWQLRDTLPGTPNISYTRLALYWNERTTKGTSARNCDSRYPMQYGVMDESQSQPTSRIYRCSNVYPLCASLCTCADFAPFEYQFTHVHNIFQTFQILRNSRFIYKWAMYVYHGFHYPNYSRFVCYSYSLKYNCVQFQFVEIIIYPRYLQVDNL